MYSHRELNRLAAHKAVLCGRIARHRAECAVAATEVLRPLAWLDRALAMWRRASPILKLAAVPALLMARRTLLARAKWLGSLLRWGPVILGLWRTFSTLKL